MIKILVMVVTYKINYAFKLLELHCFEWIQTGHGNSSVDSVRWVRPVARHSTWPAIWLPLVWGTIKAGCKGKILWCLSCAARYVVTHRCKGIKLFDKMAVQQGLVLSFYPRVNVLMTLGCPCFVVQVLLHATCNTGGTTSFTVRNTVQSLRVSCCHHFLVSLFFFI